MCRTSHNFGIWRCSWWALLLGLLASGTCSAACVTYSYTLTASNVITGDFTVSDVAADIDTRCNSGSTSGCPSASNGCTHGWSLSQSGTGTSITGTCLTASNVSTPATTSATSNTGTCPNCPSGVHQTTSGTATSLAAIPQQIIIGGCTFRADGIGVVVPDGPLKGYAQSYTSTGTAATDTGSTDYQPSSSKGNGQNCVTNSSGVQTCVDTSNPGCGLVNGDQVCPQVVPPGKCVGYDSGGVACGASNGAAAPSPPAPGTSSSPATPDASTYGTVPPSTQGPDAGGTTTLSSTYYTSTTVSGAGAGTTVGAGGAPIGGGSSGSGGGTGTSCGSTGSPCSVTDANAAANGDCSSGDCSTGGNPLPTYDWSSDSWAGATTSFWNAVAAGPVGTAVNGMASAWPTDGTCPSMTVALATVNLTADYGTTFCNLWESAAAPTLTVVMLAVWSMVAVFIFLSG